MLPHELIPHLRNPPLGPFPNQYHVDFTASFPPPIRLDGGDHTNVSRHSQGSLSPALPSPSEERAPSRSSSIQDLLNPAEEPTSAKVHTSDSSPASSPTSITSPFEPARNANDSTHNTSPETQASQDVLRHSPAEGSVSKKRSFADLEQKEDINSVFSGSPAFPSSQEKPNVRLAMSMDGSVKVKTTEAETPSPPKQRYVAPNLDIKRGGSLQRSRSEVGPSSPSGDDHRNQQRNFHGIFGRSRDARTWEFFCDSDARDALATQAERERSGSAIGAISLIRSQSKKSKENLRAHQKQQQRREALHPKIGATNTQMAVHSYSNEKPKLSRAKSSMGRLQHDQVWEVNTGDGSDMIKHSRPVHVRSTSTDSDKENWAPGTRASENPLRRAPMSTSVAPHNVLREKDHTRGHATGSAGSHKRARTSKRGGDGVTDKENATSDEEIVAFMATRGDSNVSAKPQADDLDCIQGLLSLSQGAWR